MPAADVDDAPVKVPVQRQEGDLASGENRVRHETHFFKADRAARLDFRDDEADFVHVALKDDVRGRLVRFMAGDEVADIVAPQLRSRCLSASL